MKKMQNGRAANFLPVISVRQPWAHAIMYLGKDIENRSWRTRYRGPILIHAAGRYCWDGHDAMLDIVDEEHLPEEVDLGAAVGICVLSDVVEEHDSKWFFGPYGFVLERVTPFETPIPMRGQQRIFRAPAEVVTQIPTALILGLQEAE